MAGGNFDKGVSEIRPGTYLNFTDYDLQAAVSGGGSGSGAGGSGHPPDYLIGKIIGIAVPASFTNYLRDFPYASETTYCGALF